MTIVRTPPFFKGGIDFFKFGQEGGDSKFFLIRGGIAKRGGHILKKGGIKIFQIVLLEYHKNKEIKMQYDKNCITVYVFDNIQQ